MMIAISTPFALTGLLVVLSILAGAAFVYLLVTLVKDRSEQLVAQREFVKRQENPYRRF